VNLWHRHGPWQPLAVSCSATERYLFDEGVSDYVTFVAMRCKDCGTLKSKRLYGRFTLEQLTVDPETVAKVLGDLEGK
jgi:hypothetical protein